MRAGSDQFVLVWRVRVLTWRKRASRLAGEGRLEEAEPLAAEAREIFERLRATPYLERLDRLTTPHPAPA